MHKKCNNRLSPYACLDTMKQTISDFIHYFQNSLSFFLCGHHRKYASFNEALEDSDTYEDQDVINVVARKTQILKESIEHGLCDEINDHRLIQNLFILSYIFHRNPMKVIELGGACGASYFLLHNFVPHYFKTWTIIETPHMVKKAKEIFEESTLNFVSIGNFEIDSTLKKGDLLIAQGVLQYLDNPLQFFENIQLQDFKYIYISRTVVGINIKSPVITKQVVNISAHGPGSMPKEMVDRSTSQPLTIVPLHLLTSKILDAYHIQFLFDEEGENIVHIENKKIKTKMIGLLLNRKTDGEYS